MKQHYLLLRLGLLACLLVASLAVTAQSMFDPTHVYRITNRATGRSLEIGGGNRNAEGHQANTWSYWGGANQQWQFQYLQGSSFPGSAQSYYVTNRNSRQRLSIGSTSWGSPFRSAIQAFNSSAAVNTVMIINQTVSGTYHIVARNPNNYNEPQGISVYPQGSDNTYFSTAFEREEWDIVDVSASTPGVFRIMNVNSGKALSANEDNSVTQLPMWYIAGQEWTFSDNNSTGYISIINRNTNQVLEIGGGNWGQAGARANVWDGYGNDWQQWRLVSADGNNTPLSVEDIFTTGIPCKLINRYSGLALEIGGGGDLTRDGLAANQWYDYNGLNQQWHIYIDSNYRSAAPTVGTAVSAPASNKLTLYPNPASTTLQLTLPGNGEALQVTITDARGHTVPVSHQHGKVDVSNLASGLYIISASDGQKTFRQKFIKE